MFDSLNTKTHQNTTSFTAAQTAIAGGMAAALLSRVLSQVIVYSREGYKKKVD